VSNEKGGGRNFTETDGTYVTSARGLEVLRVPC
jgi:malate dehydrogenase (oxaloacetate-decarboxylating)